VCGGEFDCSFDRQFRLLVSAAEVAPVLKKKQGSPKRKALINNQISDYLFENFSNAKIGLFTGLLRCFVACVLCTESYSHLFILHIK